jgi:drug/metabolite transporter (DMT)-like permease
MHPIDTHLSAFASVKHLALMPLLILALVFAVMGGQFAVGKLGLQAGLAISDIVALRFGFAGLALLPVVWLRGLGSAAGVGWRRACVLALLAGSPYGLLMFSALALAPAAHGAMIVPGLTMALVIVLSAQWFGEVHMPRRYVGAAIAVGGLTLLAARGGFALDASLAGDLLFAAAGLCWGCYTVLVRHWALHPLNATAALTTVSLLYLPFYALFGNPRLLEVPISAVLLQGAYHGLLQSALVMIGYAYAVKRLGPTRVAIGTASIPVIGVLLALPLETPSLITWLGLLIVTVGMLIANWTSRPATSKP